MERRVPLFEPPGLPFLFLKRNAAGFLWIVPGMAVIPVALMIVCSRILRKDERKKARAQWVF